MLKTPIKSVTECEQRYQGVDKKLCGGGAKEEQNFDILVAV
jgi:hypothetical protein